MIHHRTAMASPTMPATIPATRWFTTSEITKYVARVMAAESGISPMMTWRLTERLKAARSGAHEPVLGGRGDEDEQADHRANEQRTHSGTSLARGTKINSSDPPLLAILAAYPSGARGRCDQPGRPP